jgi:hypothetical protein
VAAGQQKQEPLAGAAAAVAVAVAAAAVAWRGDVAAGREQVQAASLDEPQPATDEKGELKAPQFLRFLCCRKRNLKQSRSTIQPANQSSGSSSNFHHRFNGTGEFITAWGVTEAATSASGDLPVCAGRSGCWATAIGPGSFDATGLGCGLGLVTGFACCCTCCCRACGCGLWLEVTAGRAGAGGTDTVTAGAAEEGCGWDG